MSYIFIKQSLQVQSRTGTTAVHKFAQPERPGWTARTHARSSCAGYGFAISGSNPAWTRLASPQCPFSIEVSSTDPCAARSELHKWPALCGDTLHVEVFGEAAKSVR